MLQARTLVEKNGYHCYTKRLVDEPASANDSGQGPRLPTQSFLLVPVVLIAMGGSSWAQQFVSLPSTDELRADASPEDFFDDLVDATREAIWGNVPTVHLRAGNITKRDGKYFYLDRVFQEQLIQSLQNHPAYIGAQKWMLVRFNKAREKVLHHHHDVLLNSMPS
jgi:hypothetical protein